MSQANRAKKDNTKRAHDARIKGICDDITSGKITEEDVASIMSAYGQKFPALAWLA